MALTSCNFLGTISESATELAILSDNQDSPAYVETNCNFLLPSNRIPGSRRGSV
ncbi:hypothetical protein H310_03170 [Aphanomyces invadans]|uniref:Uncharacterized protein n=1 Tax=Aphanomyces invadans TaxID=157072 RepID=A0A024UGM1_9STRA|nr:hypothetical protein H310_03170 [Aphanomyces invadans]ETW05399.1 hypothetical protein H310_03170 [Aphanomyces invadans]|eukprot:XP_008865176.1 hypothetical protein H310_03170 [Aphanomyces invadans]